jgi:D-alanyl-D-alanine carboxypeptidase/D-alanyl-D-alanine-endopeptidase (penicillin-binding protein 4)
MRVRRCLVLVMAGVLLGVVALPAAGQTARPTGAATTTGKATTTARTTATSPTSTVTASGTGTGTTAGVGAPRLSTPVLSARRLPDLMRRPLADARLKTDISAALSDASPTTCFEVSAGNHLIFRLNGDTPLEPASVNKLLTATGLLQHAQPDDRLVTTATARSVPQAGVVDGDLWLVGGGDPLLTTTGYKATFKDQLQQSGTDFAVLADRIQAAGVTEIHGDIVGDDSHFDAERYVPSWPDRYKRSDTVGPMSALLVNDGVTGYTDNPDRPSLVRKPGDPPTLAAQTLRSLLIERGIKVDGGASAGVAPAAAAEVARLESPPLSEEITEMLSFSDNTTAEALNKELGRRAGGPGTTAAGIQATLAALGRLGVATTGLVMTDGSGLDDGNRMTCDLLSGVLASHGPDSTLAKALAIAGRRGTLRDRMRGATTDGKVFAKTGTLTNPPVASLAGFERTRDQITLTFALIQNGLNVEAAVGDRLAGAMAKYPEGPDLAELSPKPPSRVPAADPPATTTGRPG